MSTNVIDTEKTAPTTPERQPSKTKGTRKSRRAKPAKKSHRAKDAAKPQAKRANKKAEVIDLMRRPRGATPAKIVETTAWQKHTVCG